MQIDKQKAEEDFDNFLMIMEDQLDYLKQEADKRQICLNFSLHDLENLEELFDIMSAITSPNDQSGLVVLFARHLGEIMRQNYGGKWTLPLDDPKNVNFNKPVITGHVPIEGLEFSPIFVMRAYFLRRKKGTLRTALEAQTNPTSLDLSDLIEE